MKRRRALAALGGLGGMGGVGGMGRRVLRFAGRVVPAGAVSPLLVSPWAAQAAVSATSAAPQPTAAIIGVRVWPAQDYTRVTIESDHPLTATHQLVVAPERLLVDIEGLELDDRLRGLVGKVRPDDPYIARVRVGQYRPRTVRLVLDLKQAVQPQQFQLPPVAAYQQRLVLDLYPLREADPLLALVRERGAAGQFEEASGQDALGALIARIETPMPGEPAGPADPLPGRPAMPEAAAGAGLGQQPVAPQLRPSPSPSEPPAVVSPAPAPAPAPGPAPGPTTPPAPAPTPSPPTATERQRVDRLVIVALDPGHGGEDPGAVGPTGLREKDVVLAVALALRERLNAVPGMRAMLTRDGDFFVPLNERVRKARRVQADLFVSIHADAFMRPEARGASVFALSARGASSSAARWMAQRENAADQVGGVNIEQVRDRQVLSALLDMSTTAQIKDSLKLGTEVLSRIGEVGQLHKRQVEQAGFAVLKAPDIPSILVETAFISNPGEEDKLRNPAYRARLVEAMARGIERYFARNPPLARQRQL